MTIPDRDGLERELKSVVVVCVREWWSRHEKGDLPALLGEKVREVLASNNEYQNSVRRNRATGSVFSVPSSTQAT